MIHEIGVELQAELRAKGCPLPVVTGPEATKTTGQGRERVVIEADGSDAFTSSRGVHSNPQHRRTRAIAAKITIYAQSSRPGAMNFEHRRRCDAILDMVLVAMDRVASKRRNEWRPTGGAYSVPDDSVKTEQAGGSVYALTFTFDRAVMDLTFAGAGLSEATLGTDGIRSVTSVSRADGASGGAPADIETACGA